MEKGFLVLVAVAVIALVIWVTQVLWNWLMPFIFGLPWIGFWQTAGLLTLTSLLFYRNK